MATWINGLLIGIVALFLANLALGSAKTSVDVLTAAIDLSSKVIGYLSLAVGLGSAIARAFSAGGIGLLTPHNAIGPALFAVTGALLVGA